MRSGVDDKPNSVHPGEPGWTIIYLVPKSLSESSCHLEYWIRAGSVAEATTQFCIAPTRVYLAIRLTAYPVSFYLTFSPVSTCRWYFSTYGQIVCFLWHFPVITDSSRYEVARPAEFGLSSSQQEKSCRDAIVLSTPDLYTFIYLLSNHLHLNI
jgi:hypothetical protein